MAQSPVLPIIPNTEFVEHFIDSLENLPLDIQRHVSQLREYDVLYRTKLEQIGRWLCMYRKEDTSQEKRKFLTKIQKCLIKSQQFGDEKLNIISQIVDLVEARAQLVSKEAESIDMEHKDDIKNTVSNTHRVKLEKSKNMQSNEKLVKSIYEKPKRMRRVRTIEKLQEKNDKSSTSPRHTAKENGQDDEDVEMEEEEEEEVEMRQRKDTKKKQDKTKDKDKIKEDKEEKKVERNNKAGKVTKKNNNKQTKVKKKKKKERETTLDDLPVDPDEPVYCVCNSISYGDMIGCDNEECQIEWFHFGCVNLTHKPKGKWYCPHCTIERKEKNKK
ncbi:inhibitor of growth protein 1-like [Hydractinia symbiolongicarpus]|uniref:inhibitor of growth protein 1-like n=1 Tax=Hydractinia symbiolongicarpus TaxID=13093 RepID=UPI00254E64BC|nr:inhibitor of growth protein 1-like [Hydractinia symbiolongicarpus]